MCVLSHHNVYVHLYRKGWKAEALWLTHLGMAPSDSHLQKGTRELPGRLTGIQSVEKQQ